MPVRVGCTLFPDVIAISFIVALLRKGRLGGRHSIRCGWLLAVAVAFRFGAHLIPLAGPALTLGSYGTLIALCAVNQHSTAFRILMVGTVLNAIVIAVNGGRMPVEPGRALILNYDTLVLYQEAFARHIAAGSDTPLAFLGDVILLRRPIPRIVSLGDMFAAAGAFVLVQELFGKPVVIFGPAAVPSERRC